MFRGGIVLLILVFCVLDEGRAAQVPLERGPQNHLLVDASINGHLATLLLDTGEDNFYLQSERAKAFNVAANERKLRSGERWFEAGEIAELRIGALTFPAQEVALYDAAQFHGPVPGKSGKSADGIIGLQFLRRYRAIINCRTQQLYLQGKDGPPLDLNSATGALGFARAALTVNSDGSPTVPCSIDGKGGNLALDTGAFVTVFDEKEVADFHLVETPSKLTARTPSGRVRPLRLAEFDHLRVGGVAIPPQQFAVMDLFARIKPVRTYVGINEIQVYDERLVRVKRNVWGVLGSELLFERSAIIDLGRMILYLK